MKVISSPSQREWRYTAEVLDSDGRKFELTQALKNLNAILSQIEKAMYSKLELKISEFKKELKSNDYDACIFKLGGL